MKDCVELILNWYFMNKRNFPWRENQDPYRVWVSEIMLQQTRIDAVIPYYLRFMKRCPSISSLSEISEDELLKLWEGLGYYSRCRNLKKAATVIMEKYHGIFPSEYQDILSLPGIGEYTAGAISSICFQKKEVCVDGNVMRVYSRVCNMDLNVKDIKEKKKIGKELQKILPENSGDFNQGIMEIGEVLCLPNGMPKCEVCPLEKKCQAHLLKRELEIPKSTLKVEKKIEKRTVFLMIFDGKVAVKKREEELLKNLWEFPNVLGKISLSKMKERFPDTISIKKGISYIHTFSHKKWDMVSYIIYLNSMDSSYTWASFQELEEVYALPSAFLPFYQFLKNQK
ncbi:MAG: A/G-specific adenine glycosylase [Bacilli bacterium]|nr:A/G-specific adenine glycosylase [Bacilli bacterium]